MTTRKTDPFWLWSGCFILLGSVLRMYGLGDESIWIDEGQTVAYAMKSYGEIIAYCARDVHPPLYLFFMHEWTSWFGTSEVALRAPSALFGILTLFVAGRLARRLLKTEGAVVAIGVMALSYMGIAFSQEARSYALLLLVIVWVWDRFLAFLDHPDFATGGWFAVATALLLYVHTFAVFIIFSHQLLFLWRLAGPFRQDWKPWLLRWTGANVLALVLFGPWLFFLLRQILRKLGGEGPGSWVIPPDMAVIVRTFHQVAGGWSVVAVVGGLFALGVFFRLRREKSEPDPASSETGIFVLVWFFATIPVPVLLSWLVTPIFVERYAILFLPGFALFCGLLVQWIPQRRVQTASFLLLILSMVPAVWHYHTKVDKEQWRDVVAHLRDRVAPGEVVVLSAPWNYEPFTYYFGTPEGTRLIPAFDFVDLDGEIRDAEGVWLIQAHDFFSDPDGEIPVKIASRFLLQDFRDFKEGAQINPMLVHLQSIRVSHYSKGDAATYFRAGASLVKGLPDGALVASDIPETTPEEGMHLTEGTRLAYTLTGEDATGEHGAVSLWVRPEWGADAAEKRVLLMAKGERWNRNSLFIEVENSRVLRAIAFGADTFSGMVETATVDWSRKDWHHLVLTWTPAGMRFFVNGTLAGETEFASLFRGQFRSIHLGGDQNNRFVSAALFDDLRFFSRPLLPEAVAGLEAGMAAGGEAFGFDFDGGGYRSREENMPGTGYRTNQGKVFIAALDRLMTGGDFAAGTVSFSVRPDWRGDDGAQYVLFSCMGNAWNDGSLFLEKAPDNRLQFLRWKGGKVSCWAGISIAGWKPDQWYPVVATWSPGEISLAVGEEETGAVCNDTFSEGFHKIFIGTGGDFGLPANAWIRDLSFRK